MLDGVSGLVEFKVEQKCSSLFVICSGLRAHRVLFLCFSVLASDFSGCDMRLQESFAACAEALDFYLDVRTS